MVMTMKSKPGEMIEGPTALERFKTAMLKIVAVPHSEILRREEEYKKKTALNPRKRGPKRKLKSVSLDPADDA